ncbi:hypothetical protein Tco_0374907 [Tanacetum coccineum]
MSIQDMEDLKQQYLDEMKSMINQIQIKDYRNERIDIRYRRECEIKIDELKGKFNGISIKINKKKELRQLEQAANVSTHTPEPLRRFNSIYYDDDDDEESTIPLRDINSELPLSVAITPDLPITDSLIMEDEDPNTIPETESDEFIKCSVEDLVPIPSESEDTSGSDSVCDLHACNDFSPINVSEEKSVTFSNPFFDSNDDFTSSDDESLSDEDVLEDIDIESQDSYLSKLDEPDLLVTPLSKLNEDECLDPGGDFILEEIEACLTSDSIPPSIDDDDFDPEGDILLLEKLLNDDPSSPLPLKELNFEKLKEIKSDVDTIPNLHPEVFLDRDPRSLEDEPDKDDLKNIVKVFDPGIHKKIFSPTYVKLPFEMPLSFDWLRNVEYDQGRLKDGLRLKGQDWKMGDSLERLEAYLRCYK